MRRCNYFLNCKWWSKSACTSSKPGNPFPFWLRWHFCRNKFTLLLIKNWKKNSGRERRRKSCASQQWPLKKEKSNQKNKPKITQKKTARERKIRIDRRSIYWFNGIVRNFFVLFFMIIISHTHSRRPFLFSFFFFSFSFFFCHFKTIFSNCIKDDLNRIDWETSFFGELSFTGFYHVLPSFTGFYWAWFSFLLVIGFTGFYHVLPSFTGFY